MILPPAIAEMPPAQYVCIVESAQTYSVPTLSLLAIWAVEGGRMGEVSKNRNASHDHGSFQINSFWTDKFSKWFQVPATLIRDDFCMNARAAAYVLRYEINRAGGDFWKGVGAYHSPTPAKAERYRQKVKRAADTIFYRETGQVHP